jgi:two-component system, OmpR family, copper resistance phosphate regulon response regulator CusR
MKILIVEDDPEISALVREGLDEAGYTTMVSRDGERGLKLALGDSFSLVILDVMLPSMNGFDICRELRLRSHNVPVLMLTAKDAVPDRVGGLEAGADDYLVKPFDFNELLARVRALLRREHTIKQAVIQVDDLIVDTSSKVVKRNNKEIALTGREYKLLEALVTHTGQILSRQAIQERVWLDEQSVSNTVDVFIKNLRKKIDDGAETKLIHTVHGLGYTLRTEGQSG